MITKLNPDAIQDKSITAEKLSDDYYTDAEVDILLEEVREDMAKEYLPLNKIQTVSLPTTSGNITKDVYDAMFVADVVKFIYNNGQYELTMSSKERSVIENERKIIYSTIFFSVSNEGNVFKLFSVSFNTPSSSANAVSYQVTLANLAIGAATVSE
jgi:hypothetical protein